MGKDGGVGARDSGPAATSHPTAQQQAQDTGATKAWSCLLRGSKSSSFHYTGISFWNARTGKLINDTQAKHTHSCKTQ